MSVTGEHAGMVAAILKERGLTLAVAESCTGGSLGDSLTDVPGSSKFFTAGIVSYSEDAKMKLLGIPPGLLREHGPVSAEVTEAMADAVRTITGAAVGVAVTGAAGPDAPPGVDLGDVYTAVSMDGYAAPARKHRCQGERRVVKMEAVRLALEHLLDALDG